MKKLLSAVLAVIILMINIPLYGSAGATIEVFLIPDVSVVPADGVINYTVVLDVGEPLALLQFSLDIRNYAFACVSTDDLSCRFASRHRGTVCANGYCRW